VKFLLDRKYWKLALLPIALVALYWSLVRGGFLFPLSLAPEIFCTQNCDRETTLPSTLPGTELLNYDTPLSPQFTNPEKIAILIEKSKYRLTLFYQNEPIKSYPVVFGGDPVGDKQKEGDRRTPEGIFEIRDRYPHPSWSKFIWLDYPNASSWRKHLQAKQHGEIAWFDRVGSEIGIHGVPNNADGYIDTRTNWTLGCISLKNADVNEIYTVVREGTIVKIVP